MEYISLYEDDMLLLNELGLTAYGIYVLYYLW